MPSHFQMGCTSFKSGCISFIFPLLRCPLSFFPSHMCSGVWEFVLDFLGWCEYRFFDLLAVSIYCTIYWSLETPMRVCSFQKSKRRAVSYHYSPMAIGNSFDQIFPFCLCFSVLNITLLSVHFHCHICVPLCVWFNMSSVSILTDTS